MLPPTMFISKKKLSCKHKVNKMVMRRSRTPMFCIRGRDRQDVTLISAVDKHTTHLTRHLPARNDRN